MPQCRRRGLGARAGADITVTTDPVAAVKGAHAVITDTWVSMSDTESAQRVSAFEPYRVNAALMAHAAADALFLHCLPAHIGEEVTEDVFEGPQSVVFDEAENRLHAQRAFLSGRCVARTGSNTERNPRHDRTRRPASPAHRHRGRAGSAGLGGKERARHLCHPAHARYPHRPDPGRLSGLPGRRGPHAGPGHGA
ncbi:hypothetical protein RAA17_23020 [Komagataeibacter rhaeticus]|nr:hypothetical protein [Komagataeibacter rhaeticus]